MTESTEQSRAHLLAEQFTHLNDEVIALVRACGEVQWQAECPHDERTVGVIAHHIAASYPAVAAMIEAVAMGQPLPALTQEEIDHNNARHAHVNAACTPDETVTLLRYNGRAAVLVIRGLSDEALTRPSGVLTADLLITDLLIGHAQRHLANIQALAGD